MDLTYKEYVDFFKIDENHTVNNYLVAIEKQPELLQYFKVDIIDIDTYMKICLTAIKKTNNVFNYIDTNIFNNEQYYKYCTYLIDIHTYLLEYIDYKRLSKEQYSELWINAVIKNYKTFKNVHLKYDYLIPGTYAMITIQVIKNNPLQLRHINTYNPDYATNPELYYELCQIAVEKNNEALKYIDYFHITSSDLKVPANTDIFGDNVVTIVTDVTDVTDVTQDTFISKHGTVSTYEKLCRDALKKDPLALRFINLQTLDMCLTAVNINGNALEYVKGQTVSNYIEIAHAAVKENGDSIRFINTNNFLSKEAYKEIALVAINRMVFSLKYVYVNDPNIYYDICSVAIKKRNLIICDVRKELLTPELYKKLRVEVYTATYNMLNNNKSGFIGMVQKEVASGTLEEFIENSMQNNLFIQYT